MRSSVNGRNLRRALRAKEEIFFPRRGKNFTAGRASAFARKALPAQRFRAPPRAARGRDAP
jgi:hypothetical protein